MTRGEYYMPQSTGVCLGCGERLPGAFLDLGETPLANSYFRPADEAKEEAFYRLSVAYCPACHLVQITHRVAPEVMFSDYLYFSSFSNAFLRHAQEMAKELIGHMQLNAESLVMEVGSNDGYLLEYFRQARIPVLGIEPAANVARVANEKGIPTLDCFFGEKTADDIAGRKGRADLIIGNNVLAHVPLINDFLNAVNRCLKPGGSAVFEFPYLRDLLDKLEFDTIYHEHVFYFSLSAMRLLAGRAGLELYDVSRQPIHGGSLRVFLQKEQGRHPVAGSVTRMLDEEKEYGITGSEVYGNFGARVRDLKTWLSGMLKELKAAGSSIAAYGAAAKGSTLLNYMGAGKDIIDFVADRSTYKQGLLMPGTGIPILHQDELLRRMPDYTLLLAWNFAEEIIVQQSEYCCRGGRFIIPLPEPRFV